MTLSTHVLDVTSGQPATGIAVQLETFSANAWHHLADAITDTNGRCGNLLPDTHLTSPPSIYRLRFNTGTYFAARHESSLYPYVDIVFTIADERHHHIPLLLAANGYTTYRGS